MDNIIQCECGVKVRLPENSADVAVRCPRCHASLVVVACAPALMGAGANAGSSTGLLCPVCQSVIGSEEPAEMCPECHQTHHAECWTEMGGCATYGCKKAPAFS